MNFYTDFYLAFPDEATFKAVWPWKHEDAPVDPYPGALDVVGEKNGKWLVNVRLAMGEPLPEALQPYSLPEPQQPVRVFA